MKCRICGNETKVVVGINLEDVPICHPCCDSITKQIAMMSFVIPARSKVCPCWHGHWRWSSPTKVEYSLTCDYCGARFDTAESLPTKETLAIGRHYELPGEPREPLKEKP